MTEAEAAAVPAKGLLARIAGVVTSPKATFAAIVAHPKPVGVLFLSALVIGLAAGLPQFSEQGRQAAIKMNVDNVERFTGQKVTDEQYARMETQAAYGGYFAIGGTLVFAPIMAVVFAALYWVVFNAVLGGGAAFKQVLAVVSHSQVIGALGGLIGAPIQFLQGTISVGGPFNLGVLVPMLDEHSTLVRVLTATSVFAIWQFFTTGTGLGVLFKRNGVAIGAALLLVYLAIAYGFASLFGSFTGGR